MFRLKASLGREFDGHRPPLQERAATSKSPEFGIGFQPMFRKAEGPSRTGITLPGKNYSARQPEITGNDVGEPFQIRWQLPIFFRGIERHNEHVCLH